MSAEQEKAKDDEIATLKKPLDSVADVMAAGGGAVGGELKAEQVPAGATGLPLELTLEVLDYVNDNTFEEPDINVVIKVMSGALTKFGVENFSSEGGDVFDVSCALHAQTDERVRVALGKYHATAKKVAAILGPLLGGTTANDGGV